MISYNTRKWIFIIAFFSIICVAALSIIQLTTKNNSAYKYNEATIEIMPTFQFHVEWLHLSVVILYIAGLIGTTNATHIHWYFVPLATFITVQLIYTTWLLLDRDSYIKEQLDLSWQSAYNENQTILRNIQDQWQCQGFSSIHDRPVLHVGTDNVVITSCYPILTNAFGSTIFIWGIGLWVVKLIQAIGLMACYALYIHINYTCITYGGVIVIENMENNALIVLADTDTDMDDEASDSDDDDAKSTEVVLLAVVEDEKIYLKSLEEEVKQYDAHKISVQPQMHYGSYHSKEACI